MVLTALIYPIIGHWIWGGGWNFFGTQLLGVVAVGFFTFTASFIVFKLLDVTLKVRASEAEEREGLDLKHGQAAYPDFVILKAMLQKENLTGEKAARKTLRMLGIAVLGALLLWSASQLFFRAEIRTFWERMTQQETQSREKTDLVITTVFEPMSLEPTLLGQAPRAILINIMESLVKTNDQLAIKPALAVSWGMIDETTWDFRLRPNVLFHDGTSFDAYDVVATFERAVSRAGSEIADLLWTVRDVQATSDLSLRITTLTPDPLLLQKFALLPIMPKEEAEKNKHETVGTGPYRFMEWKPGNSIALKENSTYWGGSSAWKSVTVIFEFDVVERIKSLIDGKTDIVYPVHNEDAQDLSSRGFTVIDLPGFDVAYFAFNLRRDTFRESDRRKAFVYAIDAAEIIAALDANGVPANQFVSHGVYGYHPDLRPVQADLEKARALAASSGLRETGVSVRLLENTEKIGTYIEQQMERIGVPAEVSYISDELFAQNGDEWKDTDIFFIGYKNNVGDSADFLNSVAHSLGTLNTSGYANDRVDEYIDASLTLMDPKKRLAALREAMRIITEEDIIGVPLFEFREAVVHQPNLQLPRRVDGFLYYDDIEVLYD